MIKQIGQLPEFQKLQIEFRRELKNLILDYCQERGLVGGLSDYSRLIGYKPSEATLAHLLSDNSICLHITDQTVARILTPVWGKHFVRNIIRKRQAEEVEIYLNYCVKEFPDGPRFTEKVIQERLEFELLKLKDNDPEGTLVTFLISLGIDSSILESSEVSKLFFYNLTDWEKVSKQLSKYLAKNFPDKWKVFFYFPDRIL